MLRLSAVVTDGKAAQLTELHRACQAPKPAAASAASLVIASAMVNGQLLKVLRSTCSLRSSICHWVDAWLCAYRGYTGLYADRGCLRIGSRSAPHNRQPQLQACYITRAQDAMTVRLGVDVGGTNTDAVVLHRNKVIGASKHGTSNDVVSSVQKAITAALQSCSTGSTRKVMRVSSCLIIYMHDTDLACRCEECVCLHAGHHSLRQRLRTTGRPGEGCRVQALRTGHSRFAALL